MDNLNSISNVPPIDSGPCALQADRGIRSVLRQDELVLPKNRRMVVQYSASGSTTTELHLYYEDKEVTFDDPALFTFGEMLAKQARFTAGDAVGWGEGYEWPQIRDLLQQLIVEGILIYANDAAPAVSVNDAVRPSSLPPSTCPVAPSWDNCEAITRELVGHPVELGHLELIVPVFRVAHISLDADQRQVGEANVFPAALRLDVPTEWRTCNFPGTRFQNERPMNVTAMRVMRAHWPQMMAAVLRVREGYLRRFPEADGAWTVGHIERLSVAVLAVPTYQLMRRCNRVENGHLHPALSSLFRVTDGVRMTMHQMLFIPISEPAWSPDQVVTVDDVLDYAERNYSFHSKYGVCAGPKAMVRELIQVLLEGRGNIDYGSVQLESPVQAALDDLDIAIDYALYGLRAYAAVFSLWPVMTRAYERIAEMVENRSSIDTPALVELRESMRAHGGALLKRTYLAHESWRASRENVYADMYQQCGHGIKNLAGAPGLDVLLASVWTNAHRQTKAELQDHLRDHFELNDETSAAFIQDLSECVMDFLLREQAILRTAAASQSEVNQLLGRQQPKRPLSATDINAHNLMQGFNPDRLPYLIDEFERLLGVRIDLDMDRLAIARRAVAT